MDYGLWTEKAEIRNAAEIEGLKKAETLRRRPERIEWLGRVSREGDRECDLVAVGMRGNSRDDWRAKNHPP